MDTMCITGSITQLTPYIDSSTSTAWATVSSSILHFTPSLYHSFQIVQNRLINWYTIILADAEADLQQLTHSLRTRSMADSINCHLIAIYYCNRHRISFVNCQLHLICLSLSIKTTFVTSLDFWIYIFEYYTANSTRHYIWDLISLYSPYGVDG